MAQPPPYNRLTSFANLEALSPTGQPPGVLMDAEYNAIKTTLDAIEANLLFLQNDDTTVLNQSIGPAQLSSALTLGFTAPSAWVTAHAYTKSPASTVLQGTALYICLVSHTSGTFANDLASGYWLKIFDLTTLTFGTASQIAVTPSGNVQTNVQVSLQNLDANKAATSHTHTSTQISDSTATGRSLLTATNVATVQALLGLGSLAFLNSVPNVTALTANLALTGKITTANLGASTGDAAPTGWATAAVVPLTSTGNFAISGFLATTDGDLKLIQNVSSFIMTLYGGNTGSLLANRIALNRPALFGPGQSVLLQYDGTNTIWRVVSAIPTNPPRGSIRRLRMGNVANSLGDSAPGTPNKQVYINADEVVLLDDTSGMTWSVPIAVTVDGTLASQAGGSDGGAIGASAWYSIWVIGNPTTAVVAGLISTSATSPTMPSGYTYKSLIGWMRTDGSSNFLRILQLGRVSRYIAQGGGTLPMITTGSQAFGPFAVTSVVPSTALRIAVTLFAQAGTTTTAYAAPNTNYGSTTSTTNPPPLGILPSGAGVNAALSGDFLLESTNFYYASTVGANSGLACNGWTNSE